MTEEAGGAPPANSGAALTPETATAQKAALMGNAEWRAGAAKANSPQWAELTRLNGAIAAGMDADRERMQASHDAANEARQAAKKPAAEPPAEDDADDATPDGFHDAPPRAADYKLATQRAQELGLKVDPMQEIALREAFHKAGVSSHVASVLYMAAITAATRDASPVAQETQYRQSAHALHKKWGANFESNVALANGEAKRMFEAMPSSVTKGVSFADYCRSTGIANNRQVVEALFSRAKARNRT